MAEPLDEIDHRMLDVLLRDGRISVRELAEQVQISRANAYARLRRLQSTGVITGFAATIDPVKAGLSASAYVTLSVRQNSWRDLREHLRRIPEVRHIALIGGEGDVMLLVRAADNVALRDVVLGRLQAVPGVLSTRTTLVFEDIDTAWTAEPHTRCVRNQASVRPYTSAAAARLNRAPVSLKNAWSTPGAVYSSCVRPAAVSAASARSRPAFTRASCSAKIPSTAAWAPAKVGLSGTGP